MSEEKPVTELSVLDQARQNLSTLVHALANLQDSLAQSDPLPPWESFQTYIRLITSSLGSLAGQMADEKAKRILGHLAVFPLPEFPGRTQEGLLGQLLRKKLEPGVEDLVAEGREYGKAEQEVVSADEQDELCAFAIHFLSAEAVRRRWGSNFTLEEHERGIENVFTGLQRKLADNALPKKSSKKQRQGDEDHLSSGESSSGEDQSGSGSSEEEEEEDAEDEMELVDIHRKPSGVGVEIDVRKDIEGKLANLQDRPTLPISEQLRYLTCGMAPRG